MIVRSNCIFFKMVFAVCLLFIFSISVYAQHIIKGQVLDIQKEPIDFAQISLSKDSNVVKWEVTDEKGNFAISQGSGVYTLNIVQMGKILFDSTFVLNKNIDFGSIYTEASHALSEIVIEEVKPIFRQKVDRFVFNVADDKYSEGLDAIQLLARTPRIEVDFNSSISMVGKGKVLVMIDGRLLSMSEEDIKNRLRGIRSENIESIEVIPVPPSRYSAEGNSGMINIVLKKNPNLGFQGLANTNLIYNKKLTTLSGVSSNYRTNKLELLFNVNYNNFKGINDKEELSSFTSQSIAMDSENNFSNHLLSVNSALNYDLNKSTRLGAGIDYNMTKASTSLYGENLFYNKVTNTTDSIVTSRNRTRLGPEHSFAFTSYVDHNIDENGKKLSLTYNYFRKKTDANTFLNATRQNNVSSIVQDLELNQNNQYKIHNVFADIELPVTFAKLELGGNYAHISNNSDLLSYNVLAGGLVADLSNSNAFEYTEQKTALYFSANKEFNSKWAAKIGFRYEYTHLDGYSPTLDIRNKDDYNYFFPSLFLLYNLDNRNMFTFSYASRIQRPSFIDLDPFRFYSTLYTYTGGNPSLRPMLSHNMELNYAYGANLFVTLMGSRLEKGIDHITRFDDAGVQGIIPENHFNQNRLGMQVSYTINASKWCRIQTSGYTLYSRSKSYKPELQVPGRSGFESSVNMRSNFTLNTANTLFFELFYMHMFPSIDGFYKTDSFANLGASLSCFLLDRKLLLRLSGNDIFRQSVFNKRRSYDDFQWEQNFDFYGRNVSIGLQYNFGNSKMNSVSGKLKDTELERSKGRE